VVVTGETAVVRATQTADADASRGPPAAAPTNADRHRRRTDAARERMAQHDDGTR